jgi:hypothetical protein
MDLGDDSKENVEREGEIWSLPVSGASRVAPAGLGKALAFAEWDAVEVEDGRDMVLEEP